MSVTGEYERLSRAVEARRLPLALVDLDAVDHNVDALLSEVRGSNKRLRVATKSIRCPAVIDHIVARGGDTICGLMTYSVEESAMLVDRGAEDILVAYPSVQDSDIELLVELNRRDDVRVAIMIDSAEHVERLATGAVSRSGVIPVAIEVDMSLRAAGGRLHLGVLRSPLRSPEQVVELAVSVTRTEGLRLVGIMGYEAQVAGLGDANPFSRMLNPIRSLVKRASLPMIQSRRQHIADALSARGIEIELFNGGGTGSLNTTGLEAAVTEVTAGSGFLCSHLFDYYRHLSLRPAALFAVQVVRKPEPDVATCLGGGYVASGEPGRDRLPLPYLPDGLSLIGLEGAGEVQTPVRGDAAARLAPGQPVFFRHAKAGELAEHFAEYHLIRGDEIVRTVPTYRGGGHAFL